MTATILAFRSSTGTTARDLSDVRGVLPQGWHANTIPEIEGPWIDLRAPNGTRWIIGRQDSRFHATGDRPGFDLLSVDTERFNLGTFHTAREAFEAIRKAVTVGVAA